MASSEILYQPKTATPKRSPQSKRIWGVQLLLDKYSLIRLGMPGSLDL